MTRRLPRSLAFQRPSFGEPPVGAVIAFAGELAASPSEQGTPPEAQGVTAALEAWGWTLCDGRWLECEDYPELYAALGDRYGRQSSQFKLPDYRGYFLRGTDSDGLVDKDVGQRTAANPSFTGPSPQGVGSMQPFAMQTHEHIYESATGASPGDGQAAATGSVKALTNGGPTDSLSPPGDVNVSQYETRPSNISVNYIIKFTYGLQRTF